MRLPPTVVPPTFTTWSCLSGQTPKLWNKHLHFDGKSTVKSLKSPQKCWLISTSWRCEVETGPEQVGVQERAGSQEGLPPSLITAPVMET